MNVGRNEDLQSVLHAVCVHTATDEKLGEGLGTRVAITWRSVCRLNSFFLTHTMKRFLKDI